MWRIKWKLFMRIKFKNDTDTIIIWIDESINQDEKMKNKANINYKFTSKNYGSSLVFELVVAQFVKANKNFNDKYEITK